VPKPTADRGDTLPLIAEVFRQHGYEGASLSLIGQATGLGKGSLYHFFPGGKEEMAAAVLAEIDAWFEVNVFGPLRRDEQPARAIALMFDGVERYFRSGRRVCLVGVIALGDARDRFADTVRGYFAHWIAALAGALVRAGHDRTEATALAEETVAALQGAIVLARALDRPKVFGRAVARLRAALGVGGQSTS
jgi:AcrR family transcriptional regulator